MTKLQESFEILEELLRQAHELISPMTYHDDLERLTPQFMMGDMQKNPGCYIKMDTGRKTMVFPICNRNGIKTPQMIKFSLKLAARLNDADYVDQERISIVISKLNRLLNRYDRPVPKPSRAAGVKSLATQKFNQLMK